MRKICAAFVAMTVFAASSYAQTWEDALTFSDTDNAGTARSIGMGNAVTAVGGDLGSIVFNPAGSAVSSFSQFELTNGVSIVTSNAEGTVFDDGSVPGFQDPTKTSIGRYKLPNIAFMLVMDSFRKKGLKSFTMGLVGNATQDYSLKYTSTGTNDRTSFAAAMASDAAGWPVATMNKDYDEANGPSWRSLNAYKAGLFNPITGRDGDYVAATERIRDDGQCEVPDVLNQGYGFRRTGYKYDWAWNMAANVSDVFYFGGNINLSVLRYRGDTYWKESTDKPSSFPTTFVGEDGTSRTDYFEQLRMRYAYRAEGGGISAKAGFLWRPFGGLRIGAAIQTPTAMDITETYGYDAYTVYTNNEYSDSSPSETWEYSMKIPSIMNAGIAYTVGDFLLLSADYEFTNYGWARFSEIEGPDTGVFTVVNQDIKDNLGACHTLRAGMEVRPSDAVALRFGYNFRSNPYKKFEAEGRQNISFGLGYSSAGSFFADAALRMTFFPVSYITPYYYYYVDEDGYSVPDLNVVTPEITLTTLRTEVMATIGWRF